MEPSRLKNLQQNQKFLHLITRSILSNLLEYIDQILSEKRYVLIIINGQKLRVFPFKFICNL